MFDKITSHLIEERNRLRAASNLPLVSVDGELRRMEEAERQKALSDFIHNSLLRERVEEKLLHRTRRHLNNPEWRPTGVLSGGGYAFHVAVNRRMKRIWRWQQCAGGS
jgi:hypothetical protein